LEELLAKANDKLKDIRAVMKKKVKENEELTSKNQKYKSKIKDLREKLNQHESP
jgi:regulator of replication initiation timing